VNIMYRLMEPYLRWWVRRYWKRQWSGSRKVYGAVELFWLALGALLWVCIAGLAFCTGVLRDYRRSSDSQRKEHDEDPRS
jgi:hypothetical protein